MNQITNVDLTKNFYCSQKFYWLTIDLEKLKSMSCCSASPSKINFDHISLDPGNLFNSPEMIAERQQMLSNQPVSSCLSTCWIPESQFQVSRRISMKSYSPTHTTIFTSPQVLGIVVGSDCNMTCIYCCKYYSSAWARDIYNGGNYKITTNDDRYMLNDTDRVLSKLSQKETKNTRFNDVILDEISHLVKSATLKEISISGGEPFLYLDLEKLVSKLSGHNNKIKIYSGLGVNSNRFRKEIVKLSKFLDVELIVSVESTGKLYELLRNGNTWYQFEKNIEILKQHNISYSFSATVSNLALLGIDEFIDYAKDIKIIWNPCTDPSFFSVNLLDDFTKSKISNRVTNYDLQLQEIISTMHSKFISDEKAKLNQYLQEFTQRRNIGLESLPRNFIDWLTNVV